MKRFLLPAILGFVVLLATVISKTAEITPPVTDPTIARPRKTSLWPAMLRLPWSRRTRRRGGRLSALSQAA